MAACYPCTGMAQTASRAEPANAPQAPAPQPQASQETPAGEPIPSVAATPIRLNVNLVVIPVVVRDARGRPVRDLQKENFEIRDNRKVQSIQQFSLEQSEGTSTGNDAGHSRPNRFVMPTRFTVLLFDDIHLTNESFPAVRSAVIKRFDEPVAAAERVAIFTTSGGVQLDFTDDRAKVVETLKRLQWKPYANTQIPDCLNMSHEEANAMVNRQNEAVFEALVARAIGNCDIKDYKVAEAFVRNSTERVLHEGDISTNQALGAVTDVVRRLSRAPGTRDIVLLSPGFLISDREHREYNVIDLAVRNRITISTIDANGLSAESGDPEDLNPLAEFADGTGGLFFRNNNDFGRGVRQVSQTAECVYLLGFSPSDLKNDGAFHKIEVRIVGRAQLTAKWRKGYLAPKAAEDAAAQKNSTVAQFVFSQETIHGLPIEMRVQYVQGVEPVTKLAVTPYVDLHEMPARGGENNEELRMIAAVFDRNGVYLGSLDRVARFPRSRNTPSPYMAGQLEFFVDSGNYLVRLVVFDTQTGQIFAENSVIQIPPLRSAARMSK